MKRGSKVVVIDVVLGRFKIANSRIPQLIPGDRATILELTEKEATLEVEGYPGHVIIPHPTRFLRTADFKDGAHE